MRYFLPLLLVCGLLSYSLYPIEKIPSGKLVTKIVVRKSVRKMEVYAHDTILATYTIALGGNPVGHKQFEGDKKTPEGVYYINDKTTKSRYHKNLGVSYPNTLDKATAERLGRSPGGDIKIHGLQNGLGFIGRFQHLADWTAGCIAITNAELDDLFDHTPVGTVIEIKP
ncbi:MAG: L,D-transpeptidase family protein [Chitinophagaceae bacterium]|nr:L,D-transpeptidase family protein [Chitinophagaceae bacterium]